ncbi:MAG TPA: anti-sigma factor [Bryobacteraceae bacterium]|jgi:anti-sigma factor RsiW
MNCADVEILLAEYVDGTLHGEPKLAVQSHLKACSGCQELADDAAAAVAFLGRVSEVEPPPELVTRILFEVTEGPSRSVVKAPLARRLFGKLLGSWVEPILQPRWAMGMGMAALAFFMLAPHVRQLTPTDLNPVKMWTVVENRVGRTWERGVKSYENMQVVYQIETRLKQWNEEAAADQPPAEDKK